jgi:F-type H+-transporting ATPase subunit gamma
MQALREIRRRIRSVENTEQITKAMEMVAAVRLKRAQAKAESSRPYAVKLGHLMENLSLASGVISHPLFEKREEVKKIALVIITSDRGLCGSYNSNSFKAADNFLKRYDHNKVILVIAGRKGFNHYKKKNWEIRYRYSGLEAKMNFSEIKSLTNQITGLFLSREVDEVFLLYTKFVNSLVQKVALEKFLNIEPEEIKEKKEIDYIFEPDAEEIFKVLLPRYCLNKIQTALLESQASEYGARMTAMSAATKNAEEMIEHLTLIRNKLRQASITREMLEIASGAEALKG